MNAILQAQKSIIWNATGSPTILEAIVKHPICMGF